MSFGLYQRIKGNWEPDNNVTLPMPLDWGLSFSPDVCIRSIFEFFGKENLLHFNGKIDFHTDV